MERRPDGTCLYRSKRRLPCFANLWSGVGSSMGAACQPGHSPSSCLGRGRGSNSYKNDHSKASRTGQSSTSPVKPLYSSWSDINTWYNASRMTEALYYLDDTQWLHICKVRGRGAWLFGSVSCHNLSSLRCYWLWVELWHNIGCKTCPSFTLLEVWKKCILELMEYVNCSFITS